MLKSAFSGRQLLFVFTARTKNVNANFRENINSSELLKNRCAIVVGCLQETCKFILG